MSDPVKSCKLYKEHGCSHVDGYLCDFPTCSMLKKYEEYVILTLLEQKDIGVEYEQMFVADMRYM